MRRRTGTLVWVVAALLQVAPAAWAQLSGGALFEVGGATTDVGDDQGRRAPMYGMGLGASYTFLPNRPIGLLLGADLLVRGFGIDLPGRVESDAGVFDQSDLYLDQYIGARYKRFAGGVYFEQRRIDRSTPLGRIGFPVAGVGFIVRGSLDARGRAEARFSYASLTTGELRLQGLDATSPLESGRSIRIAGSFRFAERWGVRAEYADITIVFEPVEPTLTLYDHRQSLLSVGVVLTF